MEVFLFLFGVLLIVIVILLVRRAKDYRGIKKIDEEVCSHPERFEINLGDQEKENWQPLKSDSLRVSLDQMSTLFNPDSDAVKLRRKDKLNEQNEQFEMWPKD